MIVGFRPTHAPCFGGTLLVDMTANHWSGGLLLPAGDLDLAIPVPNSAAFGCLTFYAQAFALDFANPQNVAMTNGSRVFVE